MKKKFIIAGIIVIAALLGVRAFTNKAADDTVTNQEQVSEAVSTPEDMQMLHEAYSGLPPEHKVVSEPASAIIQRFESGTGIIFLGFKECPWCQKYLPILNNAAVAEAVPIHYLDIRQERDNNPSEYQQIISILSPHLSKDANGQPRISTPDVSIVKDGEIIWRYEMDAITDAERTPEVYWTAERQQRALSELRSEMKALK